jgi:hypothetical protein
MTNLRRRTVGLYEGGLTTGMLAMKKAIRMETLTPSWEADSIPEIPEQFNSSMCIGLAGTEWGRTDHQRLRNAVDEQSHPNGQPNQAMHMDMRYRLERLRRKLGFVLCGMMPENGP